MRRVVPDVRRIIGLGLLCPQLGILASFPGIVPQLVELAVHLADCFLQRVHCELLIRGEVRVLAFLLRLVCALVELVELCPLLVSVVLLLDVVVELLAATEADAVAVTIAGVHRGAVHFVAGEDVVPDVLEDAAGELVVHARCKQPLAVVDEALDRHLPDPVARNSELRAADTGDGGWDGRARVDLLPDALAPVDLLGLVEEVEVAAWSIHVDPVRAAGVVVASYVHVAEARNAVVVQAIDDLGGVEAHQHVVVPCVTVGVHEQCRVGQVVVMVDDVAEVHLALLLASSVVLMG